MWMTSFCKGNLSPEVLFTLNFLLSLLEQAILRDIVVTQNFQIQGMRSVLELNDFDATADCVVDVSGVSEVKCGLFGLSFFCPRRGECGFWRRLLNLGNCD